MKLNSPAASRALSTWESRRNDPPDEDTGWAEEDIEVFQSGKRIWGACATVGEDGGRWAPTNTAWEFWLQTPKGKAKAALLKELLASAIIPDRGYRRGYGSYALVADQETQNDYVFYDYPNEMQMVIQLAKSLKLVKPNVYRSSCRGGFERITVSLGSIKVRWSSKPCAAPDYDPY